jgi:hypothetical protein
VLKVSKARGHFGERNDTISKVLELMCMDGMRQIVINRLVLENAFTYPDGGCQADALCSLTLERLLEERRL